MSRTGKQDYTIIGYIEHEGKIKISEKNGYTYFWLTPICDFPNSVLDDVEGIQIYTRALESWGYTEDAVASEAEKIDALFNFLKDSVIICTPKISLNDAGKAFYGGLDVKIKKRNEPFNPKAKFIPIPLNKPETISTLPTEEKFLTAIQNESLVGLNNYVSKESEDYPQCILWEDNDGKTILYGEIVNQIYTSYGIKYIFKDKNVQFVNIEEDDEWFDQAYYDDSVVFIDSDVLYEKINQLKSIQVNNKEDSELVNVNSLKNNAEKKLIKTEKQEILEVDGKESAFMERFITLSKQLYLHYDEKDLYNFHTAMKGDNLVILAGLSGTGKSQLIHAYSQALQLSRKEQVQMIPVRPFWQDDADLIGYADTLNSVFRPGDSGLVDTLIEAEKNQERLYLVCFDEMNLAKVEHYFSQFLSILEAGDNRRQLQLYNENLENKLYNAIQYPSVINIGHNVLFVGTINTDESTHQFSDKVLDRSNIITLRMLPFSEVREYEGSTSQTTKAREQIKFDDFKAFKMSSSDMGITDVEKSMLWELHLAINHADPNTGVSWRILKQIDTFLKNLPINSVLRRSEAIDLQLKQRILTKIKGSEEQLKNVIGIWDSEENDVKSGEIINILNSYNEISDFKNSKSVIVRKSKELSLHGFTI